MRHLLGLVLSGPSSLPTWVACLPVRVGLRASWKRPLAIDPNNNAYSMMYPNVYGIGTPNPCPLPPQFVT